jgi:DNA-binding NarL/FixJ family response regulator
MSAVYNKGGQQFGGAERAGRVPTLVVDDSGAALAALCSLLATNDRIHIVGTACDGREAVEAARLHHPKLVLMDIQMPRLNGITATALLKQELPGTQIILVSLHDSPELQLLGRQSGARAFITKQRLSQDLAPVVAAILAEFAT